MTIVVPLMLFIWFILAFLGDGNSYKNLRNKYDPYYKEKTSGKRIKRKVPGVHPGEKIKNDHCNKFFIAIQSTAPLQWILIFK